MCILCNYDFSTVFNVIQFEIWRWEGIIQVLPQTLMGCLYIFLLFFLMLKLLKPVSSWVKIRILQSLVKYHLERLAKSQGTDRKSDKHSTLVAGTISQLPLRPVSQAASCSLPAQGTLGFFPHIIQAAICLPHSSSHSHGLPGIFVGNRNQSVKFTLLGTFF